MVSYELNKFIAMLSFRNFNARQCTNKFLLAPLQSIDILHSPTSGTRKINYTSVSPTSGTMIRIFYYTRAARKISTPAGGEAPKILHLRQGGGQRKFYASLNEDLQSV